MSRIIGSLGLGFAVACLVAACATSNREKPAAFAPSLNVRVGAPIELLKTTTGWDKVRAVPRPDGQVHVLIASTELRQVVEIIADRSGVIQRRVIRSDASPSHIDGAFDEKGTLHVLLDSEHMLFEEGVWRKVDRTPWQAFKVEARNARFVPGARDLIWAFEVDGADFATPGRWEIHGIGGFPGALIWPWFTRGTRTVLVADTSEGHGPWVVVEPKGQEDTTAVDLAADNQGNVFLVYQRSRGGLAFSVQYRWVKIDAAILRGDLSSTSDASELKAGTRTFRGVEGAPIDFRTVVRSGTLNSPNFVLYPLTEWGGWMPGWPHLTSGPGETLYVLNVGNPRNQWLGGDFPILYQAYTEKRWSAPIEVGLGEAGSFLGRIWDGLDITSYGDDMAFLVWPTPQAIVGRWVEHIP